MRKQQKQRSGKGWKILFLLVLLIAIGYGIYYFAYGRVVDIAAEKAGEAALSASGLDASAASDILSAMSDEDRETVEGIIEEHATLETINEARSYLANNDTEGLRAYAESQLSEEEMQQLYELYGKYYTQ